MLVADAVAWPFGLGGAVSERLEWLTDVMEPPYGPPQTRKLREEARTFLNFDGLEQGAARRWLETVLASNRAGLWHAPIGLDATELWEGSAANTSSLFLDRAGRRFVAGGNAILLGPDARTHEVVQVLGLTGNGISTAQPLSRAWPRGTVVYPTAGARLAQTPALGRFSGDAMAFSISFRVETPMPWPAADDLPAYRDFPVLEIPPDWSSDPNFAPDRNIDQVDSGTGRVRVYDRAGVLLPEIRYDTTVTDRAGIARLRSLVYALSGRWTPIWVPSLGADISVETFNAADALDVEWFGFSQWPIKANRRDIRIQLRDGTALYRRITAATQVNPATERLVLDSGLPGGVGPDDIAAVSFMALCLQDSDVNVLRSWAHDVVACELSFKGINHDV